MRIVLLTLLLAAASGCFYRGPTTYIGDPGSMDSVIAAARECGVRHMRVIRSGPFAPRAETRLRVAKMRVGSRSELAFDCLLQWLRAHPELEIGEEIIVSG